MRLINEIIIHCTATRREWMADASVVQKRDEIERWHLARGWSAIGYHFLIDRDGAVCPGRPMGRVGAHCRGRNASSIGVALVGGHGSAVDDQFHDHFTEAQEAALVRLIHDVRLAHPVAIISGHNQYAAKACPGFDVREWMISRMAVPV